MSSARLKGFEKLTDVDEAFSMFLKALKPKRLDSESVRIENAVGRVTAKNVIAPVDLPSFDRSAVDGYAVKAEDTLEASQFKPKTLKLIKKGTVKKGQTQRIWTGNIMPKGADSVTMLEYANIVKSQVQITVSVTPGENVSRKGEDIKKGKTAIIAATRLQPHHIGLLAASGLTHVDAVRKPKMAFLSTGNELVELGTKPKTNQIINSNRFFIEGLCRELGADPLYLGIAKDDEREIGEKILKGIDSSDLMITTGGTSVGVADLVPVVVDKLGKPGIVVHGLAMRPGMPTAAAILEGKPVFALSGNPVAAFFGFEVLVRPTVLKLFGIESEPRAFVRAQLTRRVAGALGRRVYVRVKAYLKGGNFHAEPVRAKGSALYSSLVMANGYVVIPENREGLEQGETVDVHLFSPIAS